MNVEQVDPGEPPPEKPERLRIDDFNDDVDNSVRQPRESELRPWRCFGNANQPVRCDVAPGLDGSIGRAMNFDLVDVVDGSRDYQWMKLWTSADEPMDLRAHEKVVLSASFRPSSEWIQPKLGLALELHCSALGSDVWVETAVFIASDSDWHSYGRSLRTFGQAQWVKEEWQSSHRKLIEPEDCLAQVDGFGVRIEPDMSDGADAAGALVVDEIYVD